MTAIHGPSALTQADAVQALAGALRSKAVAAVAVDAPIAAAPPREYRAVERVFSLGGWCRSVFCGLGPVVGPRGGELAVRVVG